MATTTIDDGNKMTEVLIAPQDALTQVRNYGATLVDVRTYGEYSAGHAEAAINVPLNYLAHRIGEIPTDKPVLVMCQSGHRSAIATKELRKLGLRNVSDIDGGYRAWSKAGLPVIEGKGTIPLERQVRIMAGSLVFLFCMAGFLLSHYFFYGALFVGFMLALTGILGICPMMSFLSIMPWNAGNKFKT